MTFGVLKLTICSMFEHKPKEENFLLIKEIETNPTATQRSLSDKLGISLGKINYLLKELVKKGLIEIRNLTGNPNKIKKIHYLLTKEGIEHKVELAQYFLKQKEVEYNLMKQECEQLSGDVK